MNGFQWSSVAVMNGLGRSCFQFFLMNGLEKHCFLMLLGCCDDCWSCEGLFPMVCDVWSWKGLIIMADFSVVLLDPFVDLLVTSRLLKVTFLVVEMVSTAMADGASLDTLNSMIPNLSDAEYDSNIGGFVVSWKT